MRLLLALLVLANIAWYAWHHWVKLPVEAPVSAAVAGPKLVLAREAARRAGRVSCRGVTAIA